MRRAMFAASAIAIAVIGGPGSAQAAKVTTTAAGGPVPNATGGPGLATADGVLTRTFALKGKKVKGQQILDVNLTMNAIGTQDANDDLIATLIAPNGDNADVPLPFIGSSFINLKFDDQSRLTYCNPFTRVAPYCNYIQGATATSTDFGSFTGSVDAGGYAEQTAAGFNPVFKGGNPKGTWTLQVMDDTVNPVATPQTTTLGNSILEVTTGRKFVKE